MADLDPLQEAMFSVGLSQHHRGETVGVKEEEGAQQSQREL